MTGDDTMTAGLRWMDGWQTIW